MGPDMTWKNKVRIEILMYMYMQFMFNSYVFTP